MAETEKEYKEYTDWVSRFGFGFGQTIGNLQSKIQALEDKINSNKEDMRIDIKRVSQNFLDVQDQMRGVAEKLLQLEKSVLKSRWIMIGGIGILQIMFSIFLAMLG